MEYCFDEDSKLTVQQLIDLYKVNPGSFNSDIAFKRSAKINSLENGELLSIKVFYDSSKKISYTLKLRKRNGEWKVIITDSFVDFVRGVDRSGKDLNEYESTVLPGDLGENKTNSGDEYADDVNTTLTEMTARESNNSQSSKQKCLKCEGQGYYLCQMCNGNGMIKCTNFCRNGQTQLSNEEPKICYKCNGSMRINCYNCSGRGNVKCFDCIK
jgi:DnaJ-class molecular chaperone